MPTMAPVALAVPSESSSAAPSSTTTTFKPALKMNGTHPTDFPLIPSTASPSRPQEVHEVPLREAFAFDAIEDAIEAFGRGEFIVVMDDEGRENEGDLIIAASAVSTQKMAWLIKHSRYVFSRARSTSFPPFPPGLFRRACPPSLLCIVSGARPERSHRLVGTLEDSVGQYRRPTAFAQEYIFIGLKGESFY